MVDIRQRTRAWVENGRDEVDCRVHCQPVEGKTREPRALYTQLPFWAAVDSRAQLIQATFSPCTLAVSSPRSLSSPPLRLLTTPQCPLDSQATWHRLLRRRRVRSARHPPTTLILRLRRRSPRPQRVRVRVDDLRASPMYRQVRTTRFSEPFGG